MSLSEMRFLSDQGAYSADRGIDISKSKQASKVSDARPADNSHD